MENFDFIPFDGRQDLIEFTDGNSGEAFYYGADGDDYYNAKGDKLKGLAKFKKGGEFWQKGLGAGLKKVANAIVKTERKILGKSTDKASETKEGRKADRDKRKAERLKGKELKELKRQQKPDGSEIFTQPLKPADANTPKDKIVDIEGQKLSAVDVPANTPIVVSTDPKTGEKVVGVDLKPQDVTAIKEGDGTYTYYPTSQVQSGNTNDKDKDKGMSSTMKIGLAVGGVLVLGLVVYLIAKKK